MNKKIVQYWPHKNSSNGHENSSNGQKIQFKWTKNSTNEQKKVQMNKKIVKK